MTSRLFCFALLAFGTPCIYGNPQKTTIDNPDRSQPMVVTYDTDGCIQDISPKKFTIRRDKGEVLIELSKTRSITIKIVSDSEIISEEKGKISKYSFSEINGILGSGVSLIRDGTDFCYEEVLQGNGTSDSTKSITLLSPQGWIQTRNGVNWTRGFYIVQSSSVEVRVSEPTIDGRWGASEIWYRFTGKRPFSINQQINLVNFLILSYYPGFWVGALIPYIFSEGKIAGSWR